MNNLFRIGFLDIGIVDILDIIFVSILIYQVYKLIRGSVAFSIFIGFLFLYLLYLVLKALGLQLISGILGQFMEVGVIAMIVLFQQEIRKFLQYIGRNMGISNDIFKSLKQTVTLWNNKADGQNSQPSFNVTPIVESVKVMTASRTGALIIVSKNSPLKYYGETGDVIDAKLNKRLLLSIFNKTSPMHDGAVIIYKGMILAARCTLPLPQRRDLPPEFGTRHQSAMGMSEVTDAIIIVVSEETGQIMFVENGKYERNVSTSELRQKLVEYLK